MFRIPRRLPSLKVGILQIFSDVFAYAPKERNADKSKGWTIFWTQNLLLILRKFVLVYKFFILYTLGMKYFLLYIKQTLRFVLKPMSFLPAIFMMCLIFSFSSQTSDESSQLSYMVGKEVINIANDAFDQGWTAEHIEYLTENWQFYIRKAAHITEYFLLAVSVAFPLYVYGLRGIPLVLVAGSFCVGYACLDEYHQYFVSGRAAQKKDVCIDSIGIFAGIIVTRIVGWTGRMTIFRPLSNSYGKKKKRSSDYRDSIRYDDRPYKKKYRSA